MGFIDRQRAQELLRLHDVDVLVLTSPENFRYATGVHPGSAAMWRRAGAAVAAVPAPSASQLSVIAPDMIERAVRGAMEEADVRSHRIWIDHLAVADLLAADLDAREVVSEASRMMHPAGLRRPTTFDIRAALGLLQDTFRENGLLKSRVGIDLDFVSVSDFAVFREMLPDVTWVDGSSIVEHLRMIKSQTEIDHLRRAVELTEAGLVSLRDAIAEGETAASLARIWRNGAEEAAETRAVGLESTWSGITAGPTLTRNGRDRLTSGGIVKADVGTVVSGYMSDSARTFVLGEPSPVQKEVFSALFDAFHAGLDMLLPGNRLADVHRTVNKTMKAAGFGSYGRGHYGHGVGSSLAVEEWPYIAADSDVLIQPGMVLAFETPWYLHGLGALMIEDQLVITESGHEAMNRLPRELQRIG